MFTVNESRPSTRAGRISRVETLSIGTTWRDFSFVRIHTDEGLSGIGEITHPYRTPEVCQLTEHMAQRHLIGADPFDVEEIWLRMYQGDYLRGGDVGGIVVSGVDQALHDIMGKALDVPVYRLTGGACRDEIPVYANGWYSGAREPAEFADRALQVVKRGYSALKFDPFGTASGEMSRADRSQSMELVAAVREAVGPDVEIYIEAHARFVVHEAVIIAQALEEFDVGWMEEPLPWTHIDLYHKVGEKTSVPIAGGEHFHNRYEAAELFRTRAVDIYQPDVSMAGGFSELRKLSAIADTRGMVVAPHNSNSPLCTTATAHLAFGVVNLKVVETFDGVVDSHLLAALPGHLRVADGALPLPKGPGLGVELEDAVFAEHPPKLGFWNMFADGWELREQT